MAETPAMVALARELADGDKPFAIHVYRPDLADDNAFLAWARQPALEGFQIESDRRGVISIMSPTGWTSGPINAHVCAQLDNWSHQDGRGWVTDSSMLYRLEHIGRKAPDAAWISRDRVRAAPTRSGILRAAPEFVMEIRSETDDLAPLEDKMRLWISDGVLLGLLLEPKSQRASIYRADEPDHVTYEREEFRGDPLLPGFRLDLRYIWDLYSEITH